MLSIWNEQATTAKTQCSITDLRELKWELKYSLFVRCGIRTHEAYAVDLKSTPFDRSGNLTGAPWRARTVDLRVISTLLYQLS